MLELICVLLVGGAIFGLALLVWALLKAIWPLLLITAVVYAVARIGWSRWVERRDRMAELRENADREHRQIMQGNVQGFYGQYRPDVVPPWLSPTNDWYLRKKD